MAKNFPKLMTFQRIDPGISKNIKQDKYQKTYTQTYHIQTAENQRQGKNLEIKQRTKLSIEEKGKYNSTLFIRDCASKKRMEGNI